MYNSVNIPKEIKYSSLYFANLHIKKKITKYFQKIFFKISALKKRKKEKILLQQLLCDVFIVIQEDVQM